MKMIPRCPYLPHAPVVFYGVIHFVMFIQSRDILCILDQLFLCDKTSLRTKILQDFFVKNIEKYAFGLGGT